MPRNPPSDDSYKDDDSYENESNESPETPARKAIVVVTITPRGMRPTWKKGSLSKAIRKILELIAYRANACALDGRITQDSILHILHISARRRISCLTVLRYSDLVGEPLRLHVDSVFNLILGFPTAHVRLDARPGIQEGISLTLPDFEIFMRTLQTNSEKPLEERESLFKIFPKSLAAGKFNTFVRVMMGRLDPLEIHVDEAGNFISEPRIIQKWPSGDEPDIKMPPTYANHVWVNLAWMDNLNYLSKHKLLNKYRFTDAQNKINVRSAAFLKENDIFGPLVQREEWDRLVEAGVVKEDDKDMFRRLRGPLKDVGLYDQTGNRVGPDDAFPPTGTPSTQTTSSLVEVPGVEEEDDDDNWEAGTQAPLEEFADEDLRDIPNLSPAISEALSKIHPPAQWSPAPDSLAGESGDGDKLDSDPFMGTHNMNAGDADHPYTSRQTSEWIRGHKNTLPSSSPAPRTPSEVVPDSEEERLNNDPSRDDDKPEELDDGSDQENRPQAATKRSRPSLDSSASSSSPPRAGPSHMATAQASPPTRREKKKVRIEEPIGEAQPDS